MTFKECALYAETSCMVCRVYFRAIDTWGRTTRNILEALAVANTEKRSEEEDCVVPSCQRVELCTLKR